MIFVELPPFVKVRDALFTADSFRQLQAMLAARPDAGVTLGGSLRKVRWAAAGQGEGKSSGVRVIYVWQRETARILLVIAYPKSTTDTLSPKQLATLRRLVEEE